MTTKSDDARAHGHVTDEADYLHDILTVLEGIEATATAMRDGLDRIERLLREGS